jgi:hypothetical protein
MDAPAQPSGGGVVEALVGLDAQLAKITQAITQNDKVPDEIKGDFSNALQAWRSGMTKIQQLAGDGAPEPDADEQQGAVAPEVGASRGAVPMSPAGVRK